MPIDPSVIMGIRPPPPLDLSMMAQGQAIQKQMLENRLLRRDVKGKQAQDEATAASINKDTGDFDQSAMMKMLGASPAGASRALEAGTAAQGLEKAQADAAIAKLQLEGEKKGITKQNQELIATSMFSRLKEWKGREANKPVTPEEFEQVANEMLTNMGAAADDNVKANIQQAIQQAKNNPKMIIPITESAVLRGRPDLLEAITGPLAHGGLSAAEATTPTPAMVRNPDGTLSPSAITREQFVDQAKKGPVATSAALSRSGLSAQDLSKTVEITDQATGQPRTVTLGSLLGEDVSSGGGMAPGGVGGNGRYPTPAIKGAGVTTGLAPGTPELMKGSAESYRADTESIPNLRRTLTAFDQAYAAVKLSKTGRGSEVLQNLRAFSETYGVPLPGLKDSDETKNYAEASKWLSTVLTTESQRLGLGTDQARAIQAEAQPTVHTVKAAALEMLPILKGMKAMDLAFPALAQAQGVTPQKYVEWRGQQAKAVDPIAFGADLMPKDERAAYIAKLKTPEQRSRYVKGLRLAMDAGLFTADALK